MKEATERAAESGWARRLWAKDATLWTGADEARWLGWLGAGSGAAVDLDALASLAAEMARAAVPARPAAGHGRIEPGSGGTGQDVRPRPAVTPSLWCWIPPTRPRSPASERAIDPASTLFIVSSKSGSTLEPDILCRHFFALAETSARARRGRQRFIAVTDPGSDLERTARDEAFGQVFHGDPSIGGRYSVLSNFGMVPAAVLGLDVAGASTRRDGHGRVLRGQRAAGGQSRRPAWPDPGRGGRRPDATR